MESAENPLRGWRRWALLPAYAAAAPFVIVAVSPVLLLGLTWGELLRRRRAARLRRAMRRAGRVVTWEEVERRVATGEGGTLILVGPCLGWNDADVWWTRESIRAAAHRDGIALPNYGEPPTPDDFPARMENPAPERWCRDRYFDPDRGIACLVQSTHWGHQLRGTQRRIRSMRARWLRLESLEIWTGMLQGAPTEDSRPDSPDAKSRCAATAPPASPTAGDRPRR